MKFSLRRIQANLLSWVVVLFIKIFPIRFAVGYLPPNSPQIVQPANFQNFQAQPSLQYYQTPQIPENDNMQANLKILLSYLNDEAMKQSVQSDKVGNSMGSQNIPLPPQSHLKLHSANNYNFPSHIATQQFQNKPLMAPMPNPQAYTTKVRRMAVPPSQTVPQNLMNFLVNDAPNNYNGVANGENINWINSAIDQNDDGFLGNNEEELAEADENEEKLDTSISGSPQKFSKLVKPTSPTEANRAVIPPKAGNGAKTTVNGNEEKVNSSPNTNTNTNINNNNNNSAKTSSKTPLPAPKSPTSPPPKPQSTVPAPVSGPSTGGGGGGSNGATQRKVNSGMVAGGGNVGGGQIIGMGLITPQNNNNINGQKQGNTNGGNPNAPKTHGNTSQTQQQIVPSILLPQTGNPTQQISSPNGLPQFQGNNSGANSSKHNFKLIYFDARGICEPIRLLFHYAKVPFEDSRITRRQWLALKDSTVYGKVPILEVDGKPLTYCHTISRFLARTFGLAGTSSWEQAKVDEISDFHSDVAMDLQPYLYVVAGFHQGDREALRKAIFLPGVEKHFPVYVNLLKQSGSGYFVKSGLTWIDFVISEYMTTIKHFEPAILDKYPTITKFVRKVQSLPQIFDYIANREHQPVR